MVTEAQTIAVGLDARIDDVRRRVAEAASVAGKNAEQITIVAVTKSVDRATIDAAYAVGLRHFGENRVQDARQKLESPVPPDATLHMIGQLQTNKAKQALDLFDIVESVDRRSLVEALEKRATSLGVVVPILLQVNLAGEEQKAGCSPDEAGTLVTCIRRCPHLELRGLMTIAPLVVELEATRPVFRGLRQLRDRLESASPDLHLPVLSMGMSNDFTVAIEEGATHVRVGRAIFG